MKIRRIDAKTGAGEPKPGSLQNSMKPPATSPTMNAANAAAARASLSFLRSYSHCVSSERLVKEPRKTLATNNATRSKNTTMKITFAARAK